MPGFGIEPSKKERGRSKQIQQANWRDFAKKAYILHKEGSLRDALAYYQRSVNAGCRDAAVYSNMGVLLKSLGSTEEAIRCQEKALELNPDYANAYTNLGSIYIQQNNLELAREYTLRSAEFDSTNWQVHLNLGIILRELGDPGSALKSALRSIEIDSRIYDAWLSLAAIYQELNRDLDALQASVTAHRLCTDNKGAVNNIYALLQGIGGAPENHHLLKEAYMLLAWRNDICHAKIGHVFLALYADRIDRASGCHDLLSEVDGDLLDLLSDSLFTRSLTLFVPTSAMIELFLTRLRRELLLHASKGCPIPQSIRPAAEALAIQCFLNEYAYSVTKEEVSKLDELLVAVAENWEMLHEFAPVIGCYRSLDSLERSIELLTSDRRQDGHSEDMLYVQIQERIMQNRCRVNYRHAVTVKEEVGNDVKKMYEENPYPRYRYSDYTAISERMPLAYYIRSESTAADLSFSEVQAGLEGNRSPRILLAGCGTGNQVVLASRYKNANIIAIDLSVSSLCYAQQKATFYGMNNISFINMDLLCSKTLGDSYDVIECSGVLHHLENPGIGLKYLTDQLEEGGYIKLGLYSELARRSIVEARSIIARYGLESTHDSVRKFRHDVLTDKYPGLKDQLCSWSDFYSVSECRDLCFHVKEHRFSIEQLDELLRGAGLKFCGFMLKRSWRNLYHREFPQDTNMTSLDNWSIFEERHPSTFGEMYQFWAQKAN